MFSKSKSGSQVVKAGGSLTAVIQHKVVLGITVLLWAARNEHVVVPEEVLQAGDLKGERSGQRSEWNGAR